MAEDVYEKVFSLAKRRGFLYPSFELYGGMAGFYDFGPLGAAFKRRIEDEFRRIVVLEEGCVEIEGPTVTPSPVFEASGHVSSFTDPVVRCGSCKSSFRADLLLEEADHKPPPGAPIEALGATIRELKVQCPNCKATTFEEPKQQNLMFKTEIGPGSGTVGYLRPETAQGIFVDFPALYRFFRERLPFGVCQIGRVYRNEISPRQGVLRLREFSQMEVEYFVDPKRRSHPGFRKVRDRAFTFVPNTTGKPEERTIGNAVDDGMVCHALLGYWLVRVHNLLTAVGLDPKRLRYRQHAKDEMAHYANDCWDAEFLSSRFGWVECVGVADRSAYDLTQHAQRAGIPIVALRKFAEPKRVKRTKILPVHARLGPLFRQKAQAVAAALAGLPEKAAKAWSSGPLKIRLDGESLEVPPEAFERKEVEETVAGEEFVPNVVEPSFGVDRIFYAALEHSFTESKKEGENYIVLRLPTRMAPIEVGVFPLMAKDGLDRKARSIEARFRQAGLRAAYDEAGSIGRRYARMDEIGTPFCVTIDYDTLKDRTVTVRARDTGTQQRMPTGRVATWIRKALASAP